MARNVCPEPAEPKALVMNDALMDAMRLIAQLEAAVPPEPE